MNRRARVGTQLRDWVAQNATGVTDSCQGSKLPQGRRLEVEDFQRAFYGHQPDGSPAFCDQPKASRRDTGSLADHSLSRALSLAKARN